MNYCNDCKYYISGHWMNEDYPYCKRTGKKQYDGSIHYSPCKNVRGLIDACVDYKRKWWKFWVK
jgi:hypothetical protein